MGQRRRAQFWMTWVTEGLWAGKQWDPQIQQWFWNFAKGLVGR